jgi:hypothetical protein
MPARAAIRPVPDRLRNRSAAASRKARRRLSQAEADRLRGEQQGAAGTLYNAGTGTAGAITGQQGAQIQNSAGALVLPISCRNCS